MIIKIEPKYKKFSDYFFEADDENDDKPTTQTYSIKPHKRRGNDYTAIEPEDDGDNSPSPDASVLNDDDDSSGDDYTSTPDDNDEPADDAAVLNDDGEEDTDDYTATPDESEDNSTNNSSDETASDDAAVLDDDGDDESTDYTDTSETEDESSDEDSGGNQEQSEEDASEAQRKFYLYQKYVSMYNHITKQIDTLQSSSYDNIYYTSILKLVLGKLIVLKKAIYEYLMIKFDNSSYVQCYLYYETCYNVMKMCVELLQNTVDKLKQ